MRTRPGTGARFATPTCKSPWTGGCPKCAHVWYTSAHARHTRPRQERQGHAEALRGSSFRLECEWPLGEFVRAHRKHREGAGADRALSAPNGRTLKSKHSFGKLVKNLLHLARFCHKVRTQDQSARNKRVHGVTCNRPRVGWTTLIFRPCLALMVDA